MSTWPEVIQQANSDPRFRAQLKADPATACKAAGCPVPPGTRIEVIERKRGDLHLSLGSKTNVPELDALLARAEKDPAFKKELLNNPRAAVENACGERVPATCQIRIHEPAANCVRLLLAPPVTGQEELSDQELEAVAGGGLLRRIYDRICGDFKGTLTRQNTDGTYSQFVYEDLSSGPGTYGPATS